MPTRRCGTLRAKNCPARGTRGQRSRSSSVESVNYRKGPTGWPIRPTYRPTLCAAKTLCDLTDIELIHLVLERTQRDAQVLRRAGHVPGALFERSNNEVALER